MRPTWPGASRSGHSRETRHWVRYVITFRRPRRAITNRPTSPSTCCRVSMKRRGTASAATNGRATRRSAVAPRQPWTNISLPTFDLRSEIERYLTELQRRNQSAHTVRNYRSDLERFAEYFTPAPDEWDVLGFREWLGHLYEQELDAITIRRKLAVVRSFFRFL